MTNLEPIVRKLIASNMYCYYSEDGKSYWMIRYGKKEYSRELSLDETMAQAIDWFYFNVLQSEHDKEA